MKDKGFTIIETLISIIIIMLGVIQIISIISHSLQYNQRIKTLFIINQKAEFIKNKYLSESFSSINLKEGESKTEENGFIIYCNIKNISKSLKEIKISINKNKITKKYFFFKIKIYKLGG